MAEAADKVMAEAPSTSFVTSVDCSPQDADGLDLAQVARARSHPSASKKTPPKDTSLCYIHKNYGRAALKCAFPQTCKMRDVIAKPDTAAGKAKAGGQ